MCQVEQHDSSRGKVDERSEIVKRSIQELQSAYEGISLQMVSIAATTEQNIASVEEVMSSMDNQDNEVRQTVASVGELDEQIRQLNTLTGRI